MPSKRSKKPQNPHSPWKIAKDCSESELALIAGEVALLLTPGDRVLLEGSLGAGKSTFARAVLVSLGVEQAPEGSPTFALAHEYSAPVGTIVHLDLYRLRSEDEIEVAGLHSYFWERETVTLVEWASLWPIFEREIASPNGRAKVYRVTLKHGTSDDVRDLQIDLISD